MNFNFGPEKMMNLAHQKDEPQSSEQPKLPESEEKKTFADLEKIPTEDILKMTIKEFGSYFKAIRQFTSFYHAILGQTSVGSDTCISEILQVNPTKIISTARNVGPGGFEYIKNEVFKVLGFKEFESVLLLNPTKATRDGHYRNMDIENIVKIEETNLYCEIIPADKGNERGTGIDRKYLILLKPKTEKIPEKAEDRIILSVVLTDDTHVDFSRVKNAKPDCSIEILYSNKLIVGNKIKGERLLKTVKEACKGQDAKDFPNIAKRFSEILSKEISDSMDAKNTSYNMDKDLP